MKVALLSYSCGQFSDPALEFAPRWVAHHSKIFPKEDIYVVGNHVRKEFFKDVNFINRDHPEGNQFDVFWEMATTYEAITTLRLDYPCIMFASMDEFLCLRRPLQDLVSYGDLDWEPCKRLPTFDVVHDPFTEPAINIDRPTLEQRRFWKYAPGSTHPAILYSGLAPALGWHSMAGVEPNVIPFAHGACLAHFKREDFYSLHRRTEERQRWKWGRAKDQPGLSHHNKFTGEELTQWFFQDLNDRKTG